MKFTKTAFFIGIILFVLTFCSCRDSECQTAEDWLNKGVSLEGQGDYRGAIKCYDRAIKLDPENLHYWNTKGLALAHIERYKDSISCFDRALKIVPDDPTTKQNKEFVKTLAEKGRNK